MNLSSLRYAFIPGIGEILTMSDLVLVVSILPALIIAVLVYVYVDKYEKEPTSQILLTFFVGVALSLLAYFIEEYIHKHHSNYGSNILLTFAYGFYGVSLPEEVLKLIGVMAFPFRSKHFNEPLDGIIYTVMLGMGFATVENILYGYIYGLETILVRSFTAIPAHGVFAIIMGYYVGKFKFSHINFSGLTKGVVLVIFFHGVYDFFIIQHISDVLLLGSLVVLALGIVLSIRLAKELQQLSPFKV